MKQFNLEQALLGKSVVTRDGRKVNKIVWFEKIQGLCIVAEVLNVFISKDQYDLLFYYINGSWLKGCESGSDLFMEEVEVERFIIILTTFRGEKFVSGNLYLSELEAESRCKRRDIKKYEIIPIKIKE